jgi:hypothetical protein
MADIPSVDYISIGFQSAVRQQRIVDSTAHDSESSCTLQCVPVFPSVQRNDRKAFTYALDEQHCLFAADAVFAGHSGKRREHLRQAVRSTAATRFAHLHEHFKAGPVMDVIAIERSDEH